MNMSPDSRIDPIFPGSHSTAVSGSMGDEWCSHPNSTLIETCNSIATTYQQNFYCSQDVHGRGSIATTYQQNFYCSQDVHGRGKSCAEVEQQPNCTTKLWAQGSGDHKVGPSSCKTKKKILNVLLIILIGTLYGCRLCTYPSLAYV